jgi:mono/diheme cytochrome c family protein
MVLRVCVSRRAGRALGVLLAVWLGSTPFSWSTLAAPQGSPAPAVASNKALLDRYCLSCHTQRQKDRGTVPIALDSLDLSRVGEDAAAWEKVVLKMRAGLMPPAGSPRPDRTAHDAFATWLESELDRHAASHPNPGRTESTHRLNRAEYRNAVRDILDLDVDVASLLPADDVSYGFDNIAGVLKMSPTLMERYLVAAQKVSRLAVGTPLPAPNIDYFRIADDLSQDEQLPGLPFGTRGGTLIRYTFPMDGVYEIRPRLTRDLNESVPLYREDQQLEISVDGERAGVFTLPGVGGAGNAAPAENPDQPDAAQPNREPEPRSSPDSQNPDTEPQRSNPAARTPNPEPQAPNPESRTPERQAQPERRPISQIQQAVRVGARERAARNRADESWNLRVPVKAGARDVVVTFLNSVSALEETPRLPFERPFPAGVNIPETRRGAYLRSVEISGPHSPSGPGEGQSRTRIFVCSPPSSEASRQTRGSDAGADSEVCARRILSTLTRRAYRRNVTNADVEPLMAFYREGQVQGGFDAGIEHALRRLLVSPEFLLRVERDPAGVAAGAVYPVSDVELASRLSFFLWSSIPDDELLDLAARRQLSDPAVLAKQVRRMMTDSRASAFVKNFAGQWLFLRNLEAVVPVQSIFPDFDDALRQSFRRETELFFESIVREDRSALDLLRADYTFVNERLASHYGISNIKGDHFRRVTLGPESKRRGLLGQGSILTVTSYPDRTSPVVRGKWILENLLGTPPPPPLPNVPPLRATDTSGVVLPMRQRMERHRSNPVCASCHAMMDPIGLSLENFDAIGRWRTLGESSAPIDATGSSPDGTRFEGPDGLRDVLLKSDRFVATLTEKLLTYSLGRGLEYYDAPAVRRILREAAGDDYRFSSLVIGIAQSPPFRMRRAEGL